MNDLCYRGVIFSDSVVLRVVCLRVHVGTRIGTTPLLLQLWNTLLVCISNVTPITLN